MFGRRGKWLLGFRLVKSAVSNEGQTRFQTLKPDLPWDVDSPPPSRSRRSDVDAV